MFYLDTVQNPKEKKAEDEFIVAVLAVYVRGISCFLLTEFYLEDLLM
jgi:hypothetical protein